jgi:hypothetical protein
VKRLKEGRRNAGTRRLKKQGNGADYYFQIKLAGDEKAVTFALRNRRKADVLRKVG